MKPQNLTAALIQTAHQLSADVATFLLECEHILKLPSVRSVDGARKIDPAVDHEEDLLQHERIRNWRQPRRFKRLDLSFLDRSPLAHQPLERRLAGLVFYYWPRIANDDGRRPDVLHITASLLANPALPFTLQLVRFATIAGLRAQYGIGSTHLDLHRLREAYDTMVARLTHRSPALPDVCESFLIDVCCLYQFLSRSLGKGPAGDENISAYYNGFVQTPFGVPAHRDPRGTQVRRFFPAWAKVVLEGEPPALPVLLNLIYNQPTGIPGLDEALGGLRPPFRGPATNGEEGDRAGNCGGGLVTLIAGPAGVGKTTVSLAFASRMAEFGADVRYVATEERVVDLRSKRTTVVGDRFLADSIWPGTSHSFEESFSIHAGEGLKTLADAVNDLIGELEGTDARPEAPHRGEVYLDFPYVVVIDSVAPLLGDETPPRPDDAGSRRTVASLLRRLRDAQVCVFLVGERQHMNDARLAYLVDNVLTLGLEDDESVRRPLRLLTIEKTRYQISHRGRHVYHISRYNGPVISPSLSALLAETEDRREAHPAGDQDGIAVLCVPKDPGGPGVVLASRTHCLLYGWGSAGKAQIALAMGFHPVVNPAVQVQVEEARRNGGYTADEVAKVRRSRVLVISFLYEPAYYYGLAESLLRRFGVSLSEPGEDRDKAIRARVTVLDFYPGFLDPETFLGRVRDRLLGAKLEGRPFSAVVIDGIQNMLLQFPRLAKEDLLWPTLFRILRASGVRSISTFTFFSMFGSESSEQPVELAQRVSLMPGDAQRMLHHLVVGSSDYSIRVDREREIDKAKLVCTNTATSVARGASEFHWNTRDLRFSV